MNNAAQWNQLRRIDSSLLAIVLFLVNIYLKISDWSVGSFIHVGIITIFIAVYHRADDV